MNNHADNNRRVMWLASWYPSKLDQFTGDFIQRHARAAALYMPIHVVFVVRDKLQKITNDILIEENVTGNLKETIIYYSSKNHPVKLLDRFLSMQKYRRVFADYYLELQRSNGNPALIHVHVPYKAGVFALWLKKHFGVAYLVTEHWAGYDRSNPDNYWTRSFSFRFLLQRIFKNSLASVPVSEDLAKKLQSIFPIRHSFIIPNTVDQSIFHPVDQPNEKCTFIHYASAVVGHKNTEGLLRVLSKLKFINDQWRCVIYGNAGEHLQKFVIEENLSKQIVFTGEISYIQVANEVKHASAFISFSNYENQPCSLLEALCAGLPVIATRVGGISEIVTDANGKLISAEDEVQLLEALKHLLQNYQDYNKTTIAKNAIEKFGYIGVGKKFTELYSKFIS